ncbi:glycosyltransferase [Candidatus Woesearchaeota archaeon]|nr:glycosyltransferase [Candidatus Woesearchaeota archaeon]
MGLYVQIHSMHGLFRSVNLELGRDEDTGGQIVYVLELVKALSKKKEIDEIEIFTRRIQDEHYPGYSDEIEEISEKARIVRIECGPKKYIKKVRLWPHLGTFIKNVKKYIAKKGRIPDIFHSNYADSGLVCAKLSKYYKRPQIHTGHSLGIPKMKRLGVNKSNIDRYDKIYHFSKRLKAEQESIDNSSIIIGSTTEEIKQQYSGYKIKKQVSKFRNIPPGVDLNRFHTPRKTYSEEEGYVYNLMKNVINQDLKHPERRIFSVLTRLDKRKNLHGLLKAFGDDKALQSMANLVVFANTLSADKGIQRTIDTINRIIRKTNLYDNIALPGISLDYSQQVPAYYRFLAKNRGVFVNPAFIEPFGLTILEAGACGVPVAATKYGGPSEIIEDGVNGVLIDVKDKKDIAKKLKKMFRHDEFYNELSKNAVLNVKKNYSWDTTATKYLNAFKEIVRDNVR